MPDGALDPLALEEEMLRPIPAARRIEWRISWREWPGDQQVSMSPTRMTRDQLDDLARMLLSELARRAEDGPLSVARLLARWEAAAEARAG
jgi:hypothetical protein